MTWSFNFCAGFLPNDPTFVTNRYIIIGILATMMLTFVILRFIASCYYKGRAVTSDSQDNNQQLEHTLQKVKNDSDCNFDDKYQNDKSSDVQLDKMGSNDSTLNNSSPPGSRQLVTRRRNFKGKCSKFFQNIDIQELERMFSLYFGHHAVCIGVCLMYCPYFPVTICCLVYLFAGILLFYLCNSKYSKPVPWIWGIACLINMALFFGSATFVGLANFNIDKNQCYGSLIEF